MSRPTRYHLTQGIVLTKSIVHSGFTIGFALLLIFLAPSVQAQSFQSPGNTKASIMVDGRILFEVDDSWIAHEQKATRDEAIRIGQLLIGQLLIERGYMHHVTNEHPFAAEYLFYRFYTDE
ncbi:MAG: hypothetical protein F6K16_32810 [Symploca sp. SIO2B6]|nr:hypothetical protein [Symploca sp. SIO2B6]